MALCRSARLRLGLLVLLVVLLSPVAHAVEGTDSPYVNLAEGGVSTRYYRNVPFKKSKPGRTMRVGEQLRCDGRCVLTMRDRVKLVLTKGAIIRSSSPLFFKLGGNKRASRCLVVELVSGEVSVSRPKIDDAPTLVLKISGRRLALEHGHVVVRPNAKGFGVVMKHGVASVGTKKWKALHAGHSHSVKVAEVLVKRPAVKKPKWQQGATGDRPVALAADGPNGDLSLAWGPVPGASQYTMQIASKANFDKVVASATVDAKRTHADVKLTEGRYFARVWAIDVEGFRSPMARTRQIGVVRISLPQGGSLSSTGLLVVPPNKKVRILGHKKLELATYKGYKTAPAELAAPKRGRAIRLRFKGETLTSTPFRLEQRSLVAKFHLTPAQPMWPWDSIAAKVRFETTQGAVDHAALGARFEVYLDGVKIKSKWSRKKDTYCATIAGRFVDKPVLMGVVARDAFGNTLGRAYVEILGAKRSAVAADPKVSHLLK